MTKLRNLQTFKGKKVGAKKGYDLLKKKADALMGAYLRIMKELFDLKKTMGKDFLECQVAMSAANYAAGDFGVVVRDQVKANAAVRVRIHTENVAGVMKPNFIVKGMDDQNADEDLIGITGGGQAIARTRENFKRYLKLLIGIASL